MFHVEHPFFIFLAPQINIAAFQFAGAIAAF